LSAHLIGALLHKPAKTYPSSTLNTSSQASNAMSSTSGDPHFDRWTQNFTLIGSDGQPFTTDMGEINFERQWGIRVAINWASQIGASVMLIVVLMLLTKREKRKSSIFIVNAACLVLNTIRSILQCVWLTTEFFNPYAIVSNDYSRVKNLDYGNTILSNVVLLLLTACIMISLSLQVWVVCVTLSPTHRLVTMVVTSLVALVAVGYRFAITVFSNIQTMQERTLTQYESTLMAAHITQAIAVWLYCVVFTVKLGQALYQRRKMNMRQFGPMQVVFIMGCQTMIIPGMSSHFPHPSRLTSNSHLH
jgi:pheromone alpha factor receptor